jgi:hypothetical protein
MSDKEFDWNDDLDFESLADEADLEAGYSAEEESFADLDDLSDYADSPEAGSGAGSEDSLATEPVPGAPVGADEEDQATPASQVIAAGGGQALSAGGLGFLVTVTSLVAALGTAGALFFASSLDPAMLLDFSGLMAVDRILDFQAHPQNLVYIVVLGVLLLSLLTAAVIGRVARSANRRVQESEELLGRVTALRLDEEEPWSANLFKAHPDTAAFVNDVLGAWRLQQARQVKSVALEGEMRRLEKAMRGGRREDLSDRYDHPLVGSLADSLVSWYDEREAARQEAVAARETSATESAEILALIQDACSWNRTSRQGVEAHSATLKRWAEKFRTLAQEHKDNPANQAVATGLQGLQKDLKRELESARGADAMSLEDLVDRGSKLAFQIAMEVARLGPRGERLLPMSQSLEELTTQFRQAVSGNKDGDESVVCPQALLTRIEQISVHLVREGASGGGSLARTLEDLVPATLKMSENLEQITQAFAQQDTRLGTMGSSFAEMTGQEFDPTAIPESPPANPPEGGLVLTQNDPFGKEQAEPEPAAMDIDPFGDDGGAGTMQDSPLAAGPTLDEPQPVEGDGLQIEQFGFGESLEAPATEVEDFSGAGREEQLPPFAEPESPETELPRAEEKVYDLSEFGARRIDGQGGPAGMDGEEDRIYDLAEFGAVALT